MTIDERNGNVADRRNLSNKTTAPQADYVAMDGLRHASFETSRADVARRTRWAVRQGHPGYVWPDVPIADWRVCVEHIAEVITAVLGPSAERDGQAPMTDRRPSMPDVRTPVPDRRAPVSVHLSPVDPRALGVAAFTSGTGPLLGRWIEDGRVRAADDVALVLGAQLDHARRRARRMSDVLERALDALAAAGLETTVLKGSHTAGSYFAEPGLRPAADIDLGVAEGGVRTAEQVMLDLGYTVGARQTRPYRSEWVRPDAVPRSLELTHADNPISIDLHAGLERAFLGVRRVSFSAHEGATRVPWRGARGAFVLAQPLLLAYLAAHASEELDRLQLIRVIELALVARADFRTAEDWAGLLQLLDSADAGRFVYPALALADRLLPGCMDAATMTTIGARATPRMRRVLDRLTPATAHRLGRLSLEDRFLFARGPVEHVRRFGYLLWPSRSRRIRDVYAERLWRFLRRRVSLRAPRG